ncbi:hypothetical protein CH274_08045 [Rhodococcus sp. 06-418-5]|uniref:hypothetical protein n=1 Tax=Rhodococcus sp. 06-418-5 TaxID=2022507 RepID=UPI000B9BC1CE|nr:hypothetical protein [Rhodococcus sp. 06-418-5]OZC82917.1 hypothetical protein CH274_08045 [Rhodococcus sp. 06-418-5]
MVGEATQEKGREGARLARVWLERTTRVKVPWMNPDEAAVSKLTLKKAQPVGTSKTFSFDLGGYFRGESIDNQTFLAECKNYDTAQDQGTHYVKFLCACYRAVSLGHTLADNFLWIAFAPFNVTIWDQQTKPEKIKEAVLKHPTYNFKESENPAAEIDDEIVAEVSKRLWILILSEKQIENLVLTSEHHGVIEQYITQSEVS